MAQQPAGLAGARIVEALGQYQEATIVECRQPLHGRIAVEFGELARRANKLRYDAGQLVRIQPGRRREAQDAVMLGEGQQDCAVGSARQRFGVAVAPG